MPKLRDISKICNLCTSKGFVYPGQVSPPTTDLTTLVYGPLGVEIKRNLMREWWQETVTSRDNIHGIDQSIVEETTWNEYMVSRYLSNTLRIAIGMMSEKESSIGLAQCLSTFHRNTNSVQQFMFSLKKKEFYKLCFFCPGNKVSYWMDYWTRKRLSWWKKYSDIPAEFVLVDGDFRDEFMQHHVKTFSDTMAVQFNFPWATEAIECISSYSNVRSLIHDDSTKNVDLGVVIATMSVERGILAYLLDAYHDHDLIGSDGQVTKHVTLRLHPALAPVKVAIISINNGCDNTDLGRVAQQLANELRQAGINSHNFEVECLDGIEKVTSSEDMIGTPYTVTVQDSTLTNGIVMLRNRDTTLSELLHISEILKTVQQHLDGF